MFDYMFGKVRLGYEDLVRYSFLAQKSLTPLDLSTCEWTYLTPTTFTEEGFQKLNGVDGRRVLFKYHLDVSHGLEKALKEHDPVVEADSNMFHSSVYRGFKVAGNFHYQCVLPDIMGSVQESQDRMAELKRWLPLLKMMHVSSKGLDNLQYSFFARIFQEECCTDSELIAEFIKVCGKKFFDFWLLRNDDEMEHMDFFLHHTQKMKLEMYPPQWKYCPVSRSLFVGKYQRAMALIKYGKTKQPLTAADFGEHLEMFAMFSETAMNWVKNNRRHFEDLNLNLAKKSLLLLLLYVFCSQIDYETRKEHGEHQRFELPALGFQTLRLMWRSLPEAYLTLSEVQSVWRLPDSYLQCVADDVYALYKTRVVAGENQVLVTGPRSLQHLARCEVRRRLAQNFALPSGIEHLGLPHRMQRFLCLEH